MNGMTESSSVPIYLDTNVFIKAVEGLDEAAVAAKFLIKELRQQPAGIAATSEITLASESMSESILLSTPGY